MGSLILLHIGPTWRFRKNTDMWFPPPKIMIQLDQGTSCMPEFCTSESLKASKANCREESSRLKIRSLS